MITTPFTLKDLADEPDEEQPDTPPEVAHEEPPLPTFFERLMNADQGSRSLRSELLPYITHINIATQVNWVAILAVGLAVTGYSEKLRDLIPEELRTHTDKASGIVLEALSKEDKESNSPTKPFNLIRGNTRLYV